MYSLLENKEYSLKNIELRSWMPNSWKYKKLNYLPDYKLGETKKVLENLKKLPGLVSIKQIKNLQNKLIRVNNRESFFIQVGDCAEVFEEKNFDIVSQKVKLMISMAKKIPKPYETILVGRIAGQYAKPRSVLFETRDGLTLPAYHGDLINLNEFTIEGRTPNANLMLNAYDSAHEVLKNIHINYRNTIYTSHEALQLFYEEALTRYSKIEKKWFNVSTHFPWLGMRTAIESDAHVEYLRGIKNPIGIKIGPLTSIERIFELIEILNPHNEKGKITLIHRLGEEKIEKILPNWILAIKNSEKNIVWCCDPMHGNTEITSNGLKTRRLDKIEAEIDKAFNIHKNLSSFLGGIHLEVTPHMVTECIDKKIVLENDLNKNYKSLVDPRLNPLQALQIMDLVKKKIK